MIESEKNLLIMGHFDMNRCQKCNRKLKSKGLIYRMYKIFRMCKCGLNPNSNYLKQLKHG